MQLVVEIVTLVILLGGVVIAGGFITLVCRSLYKMFYTWPMEAKHQSKKMCSPGDAATIVFVLLAIPVVMYGIMHLLKY